MNEFIKLDKIIKKSNRVEYEFSTSPNFSKYFYNLSFFVEYEFDIEEIPDSILIIPFLCNVLPITWLANADVIVDDIDIDFYDGIELFKKGYIDMYPKLKFLGNVTYNNLVDNKTSTIDKSVCFFSGG